MILFIVRSALIYSIFLRKILCNGNVINLSDTECGSTADSTRRGSIVGGHPALEGEFPWMVSIREPRYDLHYCGGSIVNKRWVLTAGHCVCNRKFTAIKNINEFNLVIGTNILNDRYAVSKKIDKITVGVRFNCPDALTNDYALLRTTSDIKWSVSIKPICFYDNKGKSLDRLKVYTAGWGVLREGAFQIPKQLMKVALTVFTDRECHRMLDIYNSKTEICAADYHWGKDACQGDSGGPLMTIENNKYLLVGLVSSGKGCARPFEPGKYTRLQTILPWIKSVVK